MARWGFREDAEGMFGFETMLAGEAARPWAYRVLVPDLVTATANVVPASAKEYLAPYLMKASGVRARYFKGTPARWTLNFAFAYHIAIGLIFLCLFFHLLLLRTLAPGFGVRNVALRDLGPICYAVILPLVFLQGAYLYDFPELFILAACVWAAAVYPPLLLLALPLAVANKESAILMPLLILARYWGDDGINIPRRKLWWLGSASIVAAAVFWTIKISVSGHRGGSVEFYLFENLKFWSDPRSYVGFSAILAAGVPVPKLHTALVCVPATVLWWAGWKSAKRDLRWTLATALAINLPLVIALADRDELRNFSLSFLVLYMLALCGVQHFYESDEGVYRRPETARQDEPQP